MIPSSERTALRRFCGRADGNPSALSLHTMAKSKKRASLAFAFLVFSLLALFRSSNRLPAAHFRTKARRQIDDIFLSLVVPSTGEDFLCFSEHLIDSLLTMSDKPDECIIIVSGWDGEYDVTIFEKLRSLIPVTVVPFAEDQNQARNRNIGASLASGEYVFFFDIDDVLHQNAFGIIRDVIVAHKHPHGVILSHGAFSDLKYRQAPPWRPFCRSSKNLCENESPHVSSQLFHDLFEHWFAEESLDAMNFCCLPGPHRNLAPGWLLAHRSHFLLGGIFDDRIDRGEDGNQIARMLSHGLEVIYVDTIIGYYNSDHTRPTCASSLLG